MFVAASRFGDECRHVGRIKYLTRTYMRFDTTIAITAIATITIIITITINTITTTG